MYVFHSECFFHKIETGFLSTYFLHDIFVRLRIINYLVDSEKNTLKFQSFDYHICEKDFLKTGLMDKSEVNRICSWCEPVWFLCYFIVCLEEILFW